MGRTGGGVFNMTGKSGANAWHGSLLGQTRPSSTRALSFFAQKACDEDPSVLRRSPTRTSTCTAGSIGGPIIKNKTFFWASFEGYKTNTIDDSVVRAPNERELNGDFSQSGVTIYDPLTTRPEPQRPRAVHPQPFPGNVIPANRISPVATDMRQYWPQAGPASSELIDKSITATFKLDQQWSEKVRTSAMYAYLRLDASRSLAPTSRTARPRRSARTMPTRVTELSTARCTPWPINNTITPNATTVAHVRFGYTSFADDCVPVAGFDPGTLGFSPSFVEPGAR